MILIIPWVPLRVTWDTQMVAALATNYRGLWDNTTSTPGFPTCTSYVREYNTEPRKGTERFEEGLTVDNQMTVSASAKQVRNATHHKYGMQNINDAKEQSVTAWAPSARTESREENRSLHAAKAVSRVYASARGQIGREKDAASAVDTSMTHDDMLMTESKEGYRQPFKEDSSMLYHGHAMSSCATYAAMTESKEGNSEPFKEDSSMLYHGHWWANPERVLYHELWWASPERTWA